MPGTYQHHTFFSRRSPPIDKHQFLVASDELASDAADKFAINVMSFMAVPSVRYGRLSIF